MRISDWSSDVCSSDLVGLGHGHQRRLHAQTLAFDTGLGGEVAKALERFDKCRAAIGIARIVDGIDTTKDLTRTEYLGPAQRERDRKSVVWGQGVSVRVDLGGRRIIKKKKTPII